MTPRLTEKKSEDSKTLIRFDSAERLVHWSTAGLMLICIGSIVAMQIPSLMVFFGGRTPLRIVHIFSGLLLPFPLIYGFVKYKNSKFLKSDLRDLGHFSTDDFKWLKSWGKDFELRLNKFNGGQKANYAFMCGSIVIMIMTGIVMQSYTLLPLSFRIGATFTHKLFAILIVIVLAGHIGYAVFNYPSLKSMVTLRISRDWANAHCKDWVDSVDNDNKDIF